MAAFRFRAARRERTDRQFEISFPVTPSLRTIGSGAAEAISPCAHARAGLKVLRHAARRALTVEFPPRARTLTPDVPITPETLAPIDHFHWKGAIATEELVAGLQPKASDNLLDIGCGIGGPARWVAAKYGCRVTGVDLTAEFFVAARELNNLPGSPAVCRSCTATLSRFQRRTIASITPTRRQP